MANIITKNIPNSITCCNLISGCIATGFAFEQNYKMALLFIIIGAVFDFFDGMSARLLKVSSPIGKELDSLADDITFGIAPATIAFGLMCEMNCEGFESIANYIVFAAFLIAAFSALRLAKFNLDERQTSSFIGLPTPANALFWGSAAVGAHDTIVQQNALLLIPVIILSCYMLIAEIPMFALKFKNLSWADNKIKYIFVITSIAIAIGMVLTGMAIASIAVIILWYVILSAITQRKA